MTTAIVASPASRTRHAGIGSALNWEVRKLAAQWRTRATLIGVVIAPIPVALMIHAQGRAPKDSLFGRFATTNGFALTLLILGYAATWVLPLLTAIVAGDIVASEDQHGTWKTILTRSTSRSRIFWAKALVACGFATLVLALLGVSTTVASVLIGGHESLTGLSGQLIGAGAATNLVIASWAAMLPPTLAFTGLAILLSIATRNAAVGIAAPVVLGMILQLVGSMGGAEALRPVLPTTAYEAWHGFFTSPAFSGPLLQGIAVSALWCLATLGASYILIRRRDITGG